MQQNKLKSIKKYAVSAALSAAGLLTACAGEPQKIEVEPVKSEVIEEADSGKNIDAGEESGTQPLEVPADEMANGTIDAGNDTAEDSGGPEASLKAQFGENCIPEQTFEVELSEYSGKVWFVPFRPSEDGQDFHMQIIQNGDVLADVNGYFPEALQGKSFGSLDAVSFYDVNYDDCTDIVLIETYGDTTFAAVYYGFAADADEYERYFWSQSRLSDNLSKQVETVSISEIRGLLTGGKKNGEFSGWQEAYEAVAMLCELETSEGMEYSLIDFDGDEIPELAAGVNGYFVSLYTYHDGKVYTLMDKWGYGAMGNPGYEYSPGKNSLRNYNADYAGAIMYTTYMEIGAQHSMETVVEIVTYNFDDANGNGVPDEEEESSIGYYGVSYIDGLEASNEECESYDAGGYRFISGTMSLEALKAELRK